MSNPRLSDVFAAREPLLITDLVSTWPAAKWTPEDIARRAGDLEVDVVVSSHAVTVFDDMSGVKKIERMTVREAVDRIFFREAGERRYYLAGAPGFWPKWGRHLTDDVPVPEIPGYQFAPGGSSIWLGQAGNHTLLHYDLWHGLLVQLRGTKHVTLYGPEDSAKLSASSPFGPRPAASTLPKLREADAFRFPRLHEASPYVFDLCAGEILYIPPYWWHEVESLDKSISVPLRFDPPLQELVHPGAFPVVYEATAKTAIGAVRGAFRARS